MRILLGVVALLFILSSFGIFVSAKSVMQEITGVLLLVGGFNLMGLAFIAERLTCISKQLEE